MNKTTTGGGGAYESALPVDYGVEIDSLTVEMKTDHGWQKVLNDVTLRIPRGKILGLVGESGSGKSVTSLALMGLLPLTVSRVVNGSINLGDRSVLGMSRKQLDEIRGTEIAMIFQEPMSSLNPAFTIGGQIAEAVRHHTKASRAEAWDRAVECLREVGIPNAADRAKRYPHQFSGGMRQRAMIAMAIACEPDVLIADEPTTALDVTIQAQILDLLRRLCEERRMTMLFVTHNMGVVADICDEVAVMYAGEIVEQSDVVGLFESPRHPYAEGLLRAVPQLLERTALAFIPGSTPAPWSMPDGCRFRPRCPYAEPECGDVQKLMRENDGRTNRCGRATELMLKGVTGS